VAVLERARTKVARAMFKNLADGLADMRVTRAARVAQRRLNAEVGTGANWQAVDSV